MENISLIIYLIFIAIYIFIRPIKFLDKDTFDIEFGINVRICENLVIIW